MKFEQDLIKQFQPYLYDVVKSPTVVNPRQSTTYSSSSTMPTNYQDPSFSGWDNLKFPYLKCLPSIATLTSHSLQGDEATILLQNTSNRFTACVQLEATSVPGWIIVDLSDIVIPPHSVRNLVIRNDHQLSTSE